MRGFLVPLALSLFFVVPVAGAHVILEAVQTNMEYICFEGGIPHLSPNPCNLCYLSLPVCPVLVKGGGVGDALP